MNGFDDAAYNMAAVSATVALYRALIKKGVLTPEEATGIMVNSTAVFMLARAPTFQVAASNTPAKLMPWAQSLFLWMRLRR
jgi:hypothetical protein